MTAQPVPARELLQVVVSLTDGQVSKMAHALGWPEPGNRPGRPIRWKSPWRNYYLGDKDDPDWRASEAAGLASHTVPPRSTHPEPEVYWKVTKAGQAALRLFLLAHTLSTEKR